METENVISLLILTDRLSPGQSAAGAFADQSPPSSAEVKNE
jgi:hypothetical protein